jgi:hypothetical protein
MRQSLLVLLVCLLPAAAAPLAIAQPGGAERSMNDLRKENERLRERIEDLEAQLRQARSIIDSLREDAERMRRQIEQAASAASTERGAEEPADATAPVPDDPFAAPAALRAELRAAFLNEIGEPDLERPGARKRYLVEARRWSRIMNQRYRRPVEWLVRVVGAERSEQGRLTATMRVLDPSLRLPIGEAFTIRPATRFSARLEEAASGSLWRVEGVFAAETSVREDLEEPNLFGEPSMIAAHVVFDFSMSLRSLVPVEESAETAEGEEGESGDVGGGEGADGTK